MADAPEFDDNEPIAPLAQQSKPAAPEFDDNEPIAPLGGAPAPIAPALTAQQRYRQSLKGYHDQGTENPDVAPGYVSPETSEAFAEDKANTSSLGSQWGDVGIGAAKGLAGGVFGGVVGDIESFGRLPFQIPGVREYIADVSPHTVIPTSEEGGYLGPRGLGAFKAPETPEEKGGAFIGSMLSPNVLSGFYKGASFVAKGMAGQATFVGPLALETAYNAGYKGGESAKAFRESITKTAKLDEVVQEAKYSIANMREAKSADYVANMEKLSKDPTILNFDEIDKSIAAATQIDTFHGKVLLPLSDEVRKKMNGVIREWRAEDPAIFHTPAGFDALKKSLGGILEKTERGSTENKAALEIYNAVRKTIVDQAPEYASIMKAYEKASDTIRELESTFSIKNSFKRGASQDTALRKLQTILRDNVNASYGNREQLAQYLIANGSPNLMEKLAGQALNPYSPRGLGKLSLNIFGQIAAIAAGSMGGVPLATFAGGILLSSPHLMGNMAYLNGVFARYGNKVPAGTAARLGSAAGVEDGTFPVETPRTIPQITIRKEPPRATGGSVFDKMQNGGVPLPTPSPRMENYNAANVEMDLTPEEQALYQRHLSNLYGTGGVDNQNGKRSTLYQSVEQRPDGKYYNVPTVWDGKIETENWTRPADGKVFDVPNAVAKQNIGNAGWASFPSYATPDEADTRYDQMHRYMEKDTNQYQKKKGGSVFDKMHMARKRAEGGGTDAPFNEWDAVPRNAEGIPQIMIEKPPVNEADEAQAAREAAAARVAGNVRGAPYEPTPPSTEGKTWMMEPGKEAVQSGNYENTLPPNVRLNDAGIPYNVETGEELQMARRPSVLPLTRTPDGVQWAVPKIAELAGDIVNPLAVTKGLALNPGEFALGSGSIRNNGQVFKSAAEGGEHNVAARPNKRASAEDINRAADESAGMTQAELRALYNELGITGTPPSSLVKPALADQPKSAIDAATSMKLEDIAAMNKLSKKDRELFVKGKLPNFVLPSQEAAAPARIEFDKVRKEIKKAETEFDLLRATGDEPRLFDLSSKALNKVPDVDQFRLPRVEPKITERLQPAYAGGAGLKRLERAAEKASSADYGWYQLQQIRDMMNSVHGPKKGEMVWNAWLDSLAGTSMVNPISSNVRGSTYYLREALSGRPLPQSIPVVDPKTGNIRWTLAGAPEAGYGAKAQIQHADRVREFMAHEGDPIANPKPMSYRQNLGGNWMPRTVDTHDIRNAVGMPHALTFGENAGLLPGEYAALEQLGEKAASRSGVPQAAQQAATWIGGGAYTKLKSIPIPLLNEINRRIHVTAKINGVAPDVLWRDVLRGKEILKFAGGSVFDKMKRASK